MKNKNIFNIYLAATIATGFAFTACSDDDNESTVAPEVNITHGATNIAQGTSLQFTATVNDPAAHLSWYLNGHLEAEYAPYTFEAAELGIQEVVLSATNDLGTGADTLFLNVHKATAGQVTSINDIVNWTGEEGSNRAVLAIQWVTENETDLLNPAEENLRFRAWGFRWDKNTEPTGMDMVKAIAANDPRLFVIINSEWGVIGGFIYDEDNDGAIHISNDKIDLTQDDFEDGIYYTDATSNFDNITVEGNDLWMGGSSNAYTSYFTVDNSATLPSQADYSQVGFGDRLLTNNDWDVWTYSPYNDALANTEPRMESLEAAE